MRTVVGLSLLVLLSFHRAAAQAGAEPYKPAGATPTRVRLATPTVEVPLLLLGKAPRVCLVVKLCVNGKWPYVVAIDTVADFATFRPALAADLKLAQIAAGGFPEYRVDSLTVGGAAFHDFTVAELRTRATDIDGLLGLPI